jgi:hypothetical protein
MPAPYASAETINRELPDTQPPNIHDAIALPLQALRKGPPVGCYDSRSNQSSFGGASLRNTVRSVVGGVAGT